ncbi:DMT family transporter [Streptomyces sp. AHA2]|uniref:DMT family transporter n=1 Tax=Streptomyces sp. AHA2 TaxID=3064526 RepID=UPI002FDF4412
MTALAFVTWLTGLRHLPSATVGLIGLLNPVTGVLLGMGVAGEELAVQHLCGLVLVMVGVILGRPARATPLGHAGRSPVAPERSRSSGTPPGTHDRPPTGRPLGVWSRLSSRLRR